MAPGRGGRRRPIFLQTVGHVLDPSRGGGEPNQQEKLQLGRDMQVPPSRGRQQVLRCRFSQGLFRCMCRSFPWMADFGEPTLQSTSLQPRHLGHGPYRRSPISHLWRQAGEGRWQVISNIATTTRELDRYAGCAYHNGRFYTVTYHGIVEKYHLDGSSGPTKEAIIAHRTYSSVLTRHLVSTPWGDLLQVRAISAKRVDRVRFLIGKVHPEGCKKVSPDNLVEHTIFVGLNHSACLPSKKFPGLRPKCVYFSSPWMTATFDLVARCRGWGGVRSYDMETGVFEHAFSFEGVPKNWRVHVPSETYLSLQKDAQRRGLSTKISPVTRVSAGTGTATFIPESQKYMRLSMCRS
ncbi:hypothetical protein VPH35_115220 [Triticum aestivum]|uniref:KIB1-4 beta-propeller domain-containing protein n=1 Tax=Aegilops tauschii TaxID=37682 RepID=M8BC41_AEGTA